MRLALILTLLCLPSLGWADEFDEATYDSHEFEDTESDPPRLIPLPSRPIRSIGGRLIRSQVGVTCTARRELEGQRQILQSAGIGFTYVDACVKAVTDVVRKCSDTAPDIAFLTMCKYDLDQVITSHLDASNRIYTCAVSCGITVR